MTNRLNINLSNNLKDFKSKDSAAGGGLYDPVKLVNVIKTEYQYKYNGKEWQDELGLNWTAMDFRNYDPAIGRFLSPDPVSELMPKMTPYRFAFNNPIYWSDPTGLIEFEWDKKGNVTSIKTSDQDEINTIIEFFKEN